MQSMLQVGRSTGSVMRSKLAVNVWEEGRSTNRDILVQIPALSVQPPPDKPRKFAEEWG